MILAGRRFFAGSGRFFLGRFLVGFAPIVGAIKAGPFENNPRASAEKPFYLAMAPFREPAKVLGTFPERFVAH